MVFNVLRLINKHLPEYKQSLLQMFLQTDIKCSINFRFYGKFRNCFAGFMDFAEFMIPIALLWELGGKELITITEVTYMRSCS